MNNKMSEAYSKAIAAKITKIFRKHGESAVFKQAYRAGFFAVLLGQPTESKKGGIRNSAAARLNTPVTS